MSASEQWLLDLLHTLVHRQDQGSIGCVFLRRNDTTASLHCAQARRQSLAEIEQLVGSAQGRTYPAPVETSLDGIPMHGTVLPVVAAGTLIGELVVLGPGRALGQAEQRHLALIGSAGGDERREDGRLTPGERVALYEVLIAARDLREFVQRLAAWLRAGVVVQSATLDLLESCDPGAEDLAVDAQHVIGRADAEADGPVRRVAASARAPERVVLLSGSPGAAGMSAYVVAAVGERGAAFTQTVLLELQDLLRHQLTVRHEYERASALANQSLLEDLLSGRPGPRTARRAAQVGFDLKVPHCAVAVRPVIDRGDPEDLAAALRRSVRRGATLDPNTLLGVADDGCVIAFARGDALDLAETLRLLAQEAGWQVCAGVGTEAGAPGEFREAAQRAAWAAEIARTSRPTRPIVEFSTLGLYGLIQRQEWLTELDRFARAKLEPLLRQGSGKSETLLSTLVEVLRAPSLSEAASVLYIHHSTLRYRLKRIEELLAVSLDDPDDRFDLDLAMRVLRMAERLGVHPEPPGRPHMS